MPSHEPDSLLQEPSCEEVQPTTTSQSRESEKDAHAKAQHASDPSNSKLIAGATNVEAQEHDSYHEPERPAAVKVPRAQRRGLLSRICLVAEVESAYHLPNKTKWGLTVVVGSAAIAAPLGTAIVLPSLVEISNDFHSEQTVTNLSISFYLLSLSIFPLWWSFFSEKLGRRTVYITSFALFVLFNILTAVATNISMFIIMRMLAGGAAGSVQSVGAGTVADMWEPRERGAAMGIFYVGPLMGPLCAPIIGGALQEAWGWRSSGWFMVIYGLLTLLLLTLLLPETLAQPKNIAAEVEAQVLGDLRSSDGGALTRTSTRQTVAGHTKKSFRLVKMALIDPLLVVRYLRFPPVALCVYYASVTFASLYVMQISVQSTFSAMPYNFTSIEVGCAYLFSSLGYLLASYLGGRWNDFIMIREAKRLKRYDPDTGKLLVQPEDRMRENAFIAAVMYPAALLWYGWAAEKHAPWPAVLVANFFFGLGSMIVFGLTTTMLTEFMPRKSSSGVALNNFCRNICSCVGSLVCQPLLDAIGNGWTFTAVFILTICSGLIVVMMKKYSPRWRVLMDERLAKEK